MENKKKIATRESYGNALVELGKKLIAAGALNILGQDGVNVPDKFGEAQDVLKTGGSRVYFRGNCFRLFRRQVELRHIVPPVAERFFRAGETGHESEYFFELVGGNKCWRRVAGAEYGSLHGAIPLVLKERVRF